MKHSIFLATALTVLMAGTATAQGRDVSRRMFTFLDNRVTVEVMADAPGTLQIVRGGWGVIEAAARVPGGLSTFALGGRDGDKLRLTAVGGDRAEFIVVVPEAAYVRVSLPNHRSGAIASTRSGGSYQWDGTAARTTSDAATSPVVPLVPVRGGPPIAHTSPIAPRLLSIPRLTAVRSVVVNIDATSFQVASDHYMSVVNGDSRNVEIRTGEDPESFTISVPADTREFTLKLGGTTALVVRGREVTTYCEPVTEQQFEGMRLSFIFSPEAGRLSCR